MRIALAAAHIFDPREPLPSCLKGRPRVRYSLRVGWPIRLQTEDAISMLPDHKTRIVATIGPASDSPGMLERLIRAGMDVARLNFSHGDFRDHAERIARLRAAEQAAGRRVAIMADLPGPKMRIGRIDPEPIELRAGGAFTLTAEDIVGNARRVSMSFEPCRRSCGRAIGSS